ncbi:MAG: hypothetical protein F4Y80_10940 [Caldilineaceae bacterium SB0665_bin_21]|nr:hypothetical protein [Caldilineaceae bacterium SB0665_bin_21]
MAEPEKLESPEGERPLERGHILQRIEEAEHLLAAGHSDAAFLLAWTACEAAIRMLITEHGGSGNGITTTNHLVNQATYLGILSREEYRHLTQVQKYRNAVAHGYSHDDVSKGLISDLVESVRQMATEIDA